jgi:glycosyltransferase involved in cell wall biosynthesis
VEDIEFLRRMQSRYSLPDRFVLGLGTVQPRKNYPVLVDAFSKLVRMGARDSELSDLHLVIAGEKGWMHEDTFEAIRRAGLCERVRYLGFVQDDDLPALYNLAAVFAFPTLYEGFGLPVLEAMACGTPVVCADNSSLPEVVGDAALMVPAAAGDALAEALFQVLTDLSARNRLVNGGHRRAKMFKWEKAARQLLELYESTVPLLRKGEDDAFA